LKQTNGLYIRDPESIEVVKKNFSLDGKFVPDVAFTISKFLKGKKKNKYSVKVGITDFAVYRKYNKDNKTELDYLQEWENLITKYISPDYDLTLFYTTKEDYIQSLKFKQHLENKYKKDFIIEENSTLDELVDVISEANVLISGRMHALIIGYCYECDIVPYNISQKIRSFSNFYLDEKKDIYLLQQEIGSKVREMIGNTE
ncbi:polysaccharide pyruvyl transferase family protein, partial [Neobacillus drentensis]|uniref:polysaccharide pyruvyl transferase family protein n=1 Tax=Neobacillus drentensis TaxID=220684 RepID=UPI002FFFDB55